MMRQVCDRFCINHNGGYLITQFSCAGQLHGLHHAWLEALALHTR